LQRGIGDKSPLARNRTKKESFTLETGFPNQQMAGLQEAGHEGAHGVDGEVWVMFDRGALRGFG